MTFQSKPRANESVAKLLGLHIIAWDRLSGQYPCQSLAEIICDMKAQPQMSCCSLLSQLFVRSFQRFWWPCLCMSLQHAFWQCAKYTLKDIKCIISILHTHMYKTKLKLWKEQFNEKLKYCHSKPYIFHGIQIRHFEVFLAFFWGWVNI